MSLFKSGDHVGVDCMVDSCQHCAACKQGLEQYCEEFPTPAFNGTDILIPCPPSEATGKKSLPRKTRIADPRRLGPKRPCANAVLRDHYLVPSVIGSRKGKHGNSRSWRPWPYCAETGQRAWCTCQCSSVLRERGGNDAHRIRADDVVVSTMWVTCLRQRQI